MLLISIVGLSLCLMYIQYRIIKTAIKRAILEALEEVISAFLMSDEDKRNML
jgi:hypothetical protein